MILHRLHGTPTGYQVPTSRYPHHAFIILSVLPVYVILHKNVQKQQNPKKVKQGMQQSNKLVNSQQDVGNKQLCMIRFFPDTNLTSGQFSYISLTAAKLHVIFRFPDNW